MFHVHNGPIHTWRRGFPVLSQTALVMDFKMISAVGGQWRSNLPARRQASCRVYNLVSLLLFVWMAVVLQQCTLRPALWRPQLVLRAHVAFIPFVHLFSHLCTPQIVFGESQSKKSPYNKLYTLASWALMFDLPQGRVCAEFWCCRLSQ